MNALICLVFYGVAAAVFFVDGYAHNDSQITGYWRLGVEILLIFYGLFMAGFMAHRTHKTSPGGDEGALKQLLEAVKALAPKGP